MPDEILAHLKKIYELLGYEFIGIKKSWPEEDYRIILKKK
jgi:predicted ATPase